MCLRVRSGRMFRSRYERLILGLWSDKVMQTPELLTFTVRLIIGNLMLIPPAGPDRL